MRLYNIKSILLLLGIAGIVYASAENMEGLKTNIGILNFDIQGDADQLAPEVSASVQGALLEIGAYEIYLQPVMEKTYATLGQKFPRHCGEPRCAAAVGSSIQMDRMLYGSVDQNDKTFGVRMTLIDVPSRQVVEKVDIEGEPGVELASVIKVAVQKLHGQTDENVDTKTHTYFGPEVHNEKQLIVSAAGCLGLGVIWSLVNGTATGEDNNDNVLVYDYSNMDRDNDNLYGVSPGTDQIPMFGRPGALANAYVAASDDAYGVFFNPAGLSWIGNGEVTFGYQYRFGLNNFAASFANKATREIGFGQGIYYVGDSEKLLSEMYFISSFSYKFNDLISFLRPFSLGASLKILSKWTGDQTSPSAVTGSAFGFGLDLGLRWELTENIHYGLLFRNVPSICKWNNTATDTVYGEAVPPTLSMGGTFRANYATFLICEGRVPLNEDQPWVFAGGIEREMFGVLNLRIGIQKEADFDTPWKFTGGFGLDLNTKSIFGKSLAIDGSYEYNTLDVFAHIVNFSFRFGF